MKALSLLQPWASLVASGKKTIETRVWNTKYRGPLLICAAKGFDKKFPDEGQPRGVALCIVDVVDCRLMTSADEAGACCEVYPNAKAWVLENLRVLEQPFPVKGMLNIFETDGSEEAKRLAGLT